MANVTQPVIQINEGKVGVGTYTPNARLSVQSTGNGTHLTLRSAYVAGGNANIFEVGEVGSDGFVNVNDANGAIVSHISGYSNTPTYLLSKVGIGTTSIPAIAQFLVVGAIVSRPPGVNDYFSYLKSNWASDGAFELGIDGAGTSHKFITSSGYYNGTGLNLWTSDQKRLVIDSAGSIGINETSPAAKLHIKYGASGATRWLSNESLILESNGTNTLNFLSTDAAENYIMMSNPTSATSGYIQFTNTGSAWNINGTSTQVTNKLILYGSVASGVLSSKITFKNGIYETASIQSIIGAGQLNRGELGFYTNNGAAEYLGMYINRVQQVGIGTTSISGKMQVGDIMATNTLTIGGWYGAGGGTLAFRTGYVPNAAYIWDTAQITATDDGNFNGRIEFKTSTVGRATPDIKMVLKATGILGIGVTGPSSYTKLHVEGNRTLTRTTNSSWGQMGVANPNDGEVGIVFGAEGTGYPGHDSTYTRQWIIGLHPFGVGTDRWSITNKTLGANAAFTILENGDIGMSDTSPSYKLDVNGTIRATGDVIAYSDARVKDNVVTIENALDKVTQLRGVSYNRNDVEDKTTKIGVIAQEVLEVLPEVVQQDDEGKYSVAYGNMVGLLIEAIKEQDKKIERLEGLVELMLKNK